jgi:hypothetical protein
MSTELVISEIQRFLASDQAEVLCIRGRWGVGKTFAWRRYLDEARRDGRLRSQQYAYVSLFGLNSLDDLRYAVFESTVPPERALTGPTAETFGVLVDKGLSLGRKARSWLGPALSAVGLGEVGNALSRSAFLLVRDQLVCLDDLERAGDGLRPRDVLGMVSFLKEQRNCKVALLLNDEAMAGEDHADFLRLLEKAVDITLTFAPTATEAAHIALAHGTDVGDQMTRAIEALGITNIRVIKKIERLVLRLSELLAPYRPEVLTQAITACVLGGWSIFEPDHAPSQNFIRNYNSLVAAMQDNAAEPEGELVRWRDHLDALRYSHADDFDRVIFDSISVGYFDEDQLTASARDLEQSMNNANRDNSFSRAWDRYHHSLQVDDDEILDALRAGALENVDRIDPGNMNATIRLLREYGRDRQADDLVAAYVGAHSDDKEFLDLRNHHLMGDNPIDPALEEAFSASRAAIHDNRNPKQVLLEIAQGGGWNQEDELLLAGVSTEAFERLIEETEGRNLRLLVQTALRMAGHGTEPLEAMSRSLTEALTRIAQKSPLRARRLRAWGFQQPTNGEGAGEFPHNQGP